MPAGVPFPEYYDFFMNWKTPLAIAAIYCVSVGLFNPKVGKVSRVVAKSANAKPAEKSQSGAAMTAFVFVHNLILCIYSAVTFYNMFPAMVRNFSTHTLHDAVSYPSHLLSFFFIFCMFDCTMRQRIGINWIWKPEWWVATAN